MSRTLNNIYVQVNIILDFPITYKNASDRMRMSTSNSKHSSFLYKQIWKYLPKMESTHANVQSCPSIKKRELGDLFGLISF